jgi:hypothetical protein
MTIDRSPEFTHPSVSTNACYNTRLLRVNHQVRAEAFDVLLKSNIWIVVTVCSEQERFVKSDLLEVLRGARAQPVLELRGNSMSLIEKEAAAKFWIGEGCGEGLVASAPQWSRCFAYSRRAYGFFVITLLADAEHYKTMTITFNKQPATHIKKYLKQLIEPLFIVRGLEMLSLEDNDEHLGPGLGAAMTTKIKNGLQVAKILHGYKTQGGACFKAGDFVLAAYFYEFGLKAWPLHKTLSKALPRPSRAETNEILNIVIDLFNNSNLSVNALVAVRRDKLSRRILGITPRQLDAAISTGDASLSWMGMTDEQRVEAHECRAVAYENRADYKEQHHNENASVRADLENAARDYFFAGNVKAAETSGGTCGPLSLRQTDAFPHGADTNWRRIVQRLGRTPDTSDPAYKMLAWVEEGTGRPWLGDPRQAEHWDMEKFSRRLRQSRLRMSEGWRREMETP